MNKLEERINNLIDFVKDHPNLPESSQKAVVYSEAKNIMQIVRKELDVN